MILGKRINITSLLKQHQVGDVEVDEIIAQWVGASNVIRNQKIKQFQQINFDEDKINQSYAWVKKELEFLKGVPPEILRNSASNVYSDVVAFQKGLRSKPKMKGRNKKRKAIITNELFEVRKLDDKNSQLVFFTNRSKNDVLFYINVAVPAHCIKNQLVITRIKHHFYLSFSFDDGQKSYDNDNLLRDFSYLNESELKQQSIGIDRGVFINAYISNGDTLAYSMEVKKQLKQLSAKIAKKQRYLAKQKRRFKNITTRYNKNAKKHNKSAKYKKELINTNALSNQQKKTLNQIAKYHHKMKHIRFNFNHHASKSIAEITPKVCVMEDLNLGNMTKKAKPKLGNDGKTYVKNNKKQKSGLNKAILNVNMGQLKTFTKYKLNQQGKALYLVPPQYTSQQCSDCQSMDTKRNQQSVLVCLSCGKNHQADFNASQNILNKGVQQLLTQPLSPKIKKKVALRKTKAEKNREAGEPRLSLINSVERSEGFQMFWKPRCLVNNCASGFA